MSKKLSDDLTPRYFDIALMRIGSASAYRAAHDVPCPDRLSKIMAEEDAAREELLRRWNIAEEEKP